LPKSQKYQFATVLLHAIIFTAKHDFPDRAEGFTAKPYELRENLCKIRILRGKLLKGEKEFVSETFFAV
jgi:hypothetical protein